MLMTNSLSSLPIANQPLIATLLQFHIKAKYLIKLPLGGWQQQPTSFPTLFYQPQTQIHAL
jgi:hypothetical protein